MAGKQDVAGEIQTTAKVAPIKISPLDTFIKDHGLGNIVDKDTANKVLNDMKGKRVDKKSFLDSLKKVRPELAQRVESRLREEQKNRMFEPGSGHETVPSKRKVYAP